MLTDRYGCGYNGNRKENEVFLQNTRKKGFLSLENAEGKLKELRQDAMRRLVITAVALALGFFFTPLAGAATISPSPEATQGEAGSAMEYVQLDTLAGGPKTDASPTPAVPSNPQSETQPNANLGSDLSVPAGPEVINPAQPKIDSGIVPQSPQSAAKGAVSQIDPNAPRAFVASPIDSIPGVVSFVLILALCVGSGVGAALVISWITGKKIDLGLAR